jgi:hypothetical protein
MTCMLDQRTKENRRWYEYLEFSICSFGLNALLKVPPPRTFPRPVGGARSVTIHTVSSSEPLPRLPTEPVSRNRSQSVASTASSSPEPPSRLPHRGKTSQKYLTPFGNNAEESRSSMRPSRVIYRQSTLRGFSTVRAAQLVRFIYIDNLAPHVTYIVLDHC